MIKTQCPSREHLVEFALGKSAADSIDTVGEHLEGCPACLAALDDLSAKDTLTDVVGTHASILDAREQDAVRQLVAKVRSLHPAASHVSVSAGGNTSAFVGAAASSSSSKGDTIALSSSADDGDAEEEDHFSPPVEKDEIGRLANYRILKLLGAGGMGKVFLAEDLNLHRKVAMKVMKRSLARNAKAKQRFLQEARLAASIEHDHIVPIYQVGEDRGTPFLAMPLLNGKSLEDLMARQVSLNAEQLLRIGIQIAEGLQAAHEKGLIHRDIKPANIWIEPTAGGRVKILDFGLARNTSDDVGLTQTGAIMGTPAYMPPEQARGEKLDGRCDLYSLGCVLYRMATGELPIKGNDTISLLMALAMHDPLPPHEIRPDLPRPLSDLIMKLIAKDRDQRYATAREVASELKAVQKPLTAMIETPTMQVQYVPPQAKTATKSATPATPASPPAKTSVKAKAGRPKALIATSIGLVATLLIAAGVVLFLPTANGVVRIEVDDPKISFKFDDKGNFTIVGAENKEVSFAAGEHFLKFKLADGNEIESDRFTLKKNDKVVVKVELLKGKIQVANNGNVVGEKEIAKAIVGNPANRGPSDRGPIVPVALKKGTWEPDKSVQAMPGLIPYPAFHKNIGRWQIVPEAVPSSRVFAESPDGRWVATFFPPYVSIYDAKTGMLKALTKQPKFDPQWLQNSPELEWSPDSKWVRAAYRCGFAFHHVHFFDPSGAMSPSGYVDRIAWSFGWNPKTNMLAVQDNTGKIRLLDPSAANQPETTIPMSNAVATWSPDGEALAVVNTDKVGQIFDRNLKLIAKLEGECSYRDIIPPIWVDGGTKILSLVSPTESRVWTKDGKGGATFKTEAEQRPFWCEERKVVVVLSNKAEFFRLDGAAVGSVNVPSHETYVRGNWIVREETLFEIATGEPKQLPPKTGLLNADGSLAACRVEQPGKVSLEVFRMKAGMPQKNGWKVPYHFGGLTLSKDEKRIYINDADGLVSYDLDDAKKAVRFGGPTPGDFTQCAFSPKGDILAVGTNAGQILLCNPQGQPIAAPLKLSEDSEGGVLNHPGAFGSLSWDRDGKHLVAVSTGMVSVFDVAEKKRVAKTPWNGGFAVFSPEDPDLLLLTGGEAAVWRWKLEREPSRRMPAALGELTFGSDRKTMVCRNPNNDPPAFLVSSDLKTLTPIIQDDLKPGDNYTPLFAMLPDGKSFAASGPGIALSIRSLDGKLLEKFEPAENAALPRPAKLVVSPDGKRILDWGYNRFYLATLADKKVWAVPETYIYGAAAFTPDGKYLILPQGSALQYWNIETRELEQIVLHLPQTEFAVLSPAGEVLAQSKNASSHLRYIIEDKNGSLQLKTPSEFEAAIR
jgi:serine/threonine protein kinase/WD40 repeat protein